MRTPSGKRSDGSNNTLLLIIINKQADMLRSRLYTLPSQTYLHQPIQYRQVVHNRNGHSTLATPLPVHLPTPQSKSPLPTESRLEMLLRQQSDRNTRNSRNKSNFNYSLSLPRGTSRVIDRGGTQIISTRRGKDEWRGSGMNQDKLKGNEKEKEIQNALAREQVKLELQQIKQINYPPKPLPPLPTSIGDIDQRLQHLITRKLHLLSLETSKKKPVSGVSLSVQKQTLSNELQQLITQIRSIKNSERSGDFTILNQKIRFIEAIMAEQSTEVELMKKHYFGLNSNKKKGKIGDFNHRKSRVGEAYIKGHKKEKRYMNQQGSMPHNKPLFQDTTIDRSTYKEPRPEDYESFRYKQKDASPNMQPLPRSSYQREFLLQPRHLDQKIINRDHSPFNPASRTHLASIYEQDYRSLKTQSVNYRELDAFKNKIKVLGVDYSPKGNKGDLSLDTSSYYKDVAVSSSRLKYPPPQSPTQQEETFNRHMHQSQARRQFKADLVHEPSRIKHKSLRQAQYRLKQLFKA